jgi:ATP-dependent RNA helicase DeaD
LGQGATPLLLGGKETHVPEERVPVERTAPRAQAPVGTDTPPHAPASPRAERPHSAPGHMETFRVEVGSAQGIKPGNIVGAIAKEAGIDGVHIGRVDIREDHSFVDLPEGMPKQVFKALQKVRVAGRELKISKVAEKPPKLARNPAGRHIGRKLLSRRPAKG